MSVTLDDKYLAEQGNVLISGIQALVRLTLEQRRIDATCGLDTRASQNAMYFHGRIARLAYGGLAEAEEEGARIAAALTEGVSVVLMDNHGVLVVGDSVADAWHQLYFLERACQVQVLAQSTGSALLQVPEAVAQHTAAQFRGVGGQAELFAAVRRELDRVNPGYDR